MFTQLGIQARDFWHLTALLHDSKKRQVEVGEA
jgi:hypothetical protein